MQHAHVADIGIILEKASTHCSDEVKDYVEKTNSAGPPRIHLTFIDAGIISIQSHPDVTTIKPLKNECRIRCQMALFVRSGNESRSKISREEVVHIVLDDIKQTRMDNI